MAGGATPDTDFYLCRYVAFGEELAGVFCTYHTRDPAVRVITRNGDKVHIRNPCCVYCDVERGVRREMERERGSAVTIEEVRRAIEAARKVDTRARRRDDLHEDAATRR